MNRLGLGLSFLVTAGLVPFAVAAEEEATRSLTEVATFQHFIANDPLDGAHGLPPSPGAPLRYGPVVITMDPDGNALEAIDEQDLRYFDGRYYLFGQSFTYGTFNYSPGVNTGPIIPTEPGSFYRYGGLVTYVSDDLMNWDYVSRQFLQDPETGALYVVKKPRVVYSEATGNYVLWFLNGQAGGSTESRYFIAEAKSPLGPWENIRRPTNESDPTLENLGSDFGINIGPDGTTWMVTSHRGINTFRLNDEMTGTLDAYSVPVPVAGMSVSEAVQSGIAFDTIFGGIGMHYNDGWWYITGSNLCGNCIASRSYFLMARDPSGPWMSPEDFSTETPVTPALFSEDTGHAQVHSSVMLPDADGNTHGLIPATRYRSNPEGAPADTDRQAGDTNLALGGLYLIPLEYDDEGRIEMLDIRPSLEFPLAQPVRTSVPVPYQASLTITSTSTVVQSWEGVEGEPLAALLPSVFQRTPDLSPEPVARAIPMEPEANAPLEARLDLPDGRSHTWTIDPRTVRWAPAIVPLNLPEPFDGAGTVTLTLSSRVTNGGYGVAVGTPNMLRESAYSVITEDGTTAYPNAEMMLRLSDEPRGAPRITAQPRSVQVVAGSEAGFAVKAEGDGLGFQWTRHGEVVRAPNGLNESTAPTLRLADVSADDAGTYVVTVFNQAGSVASAPVTLEVLEP
ncbi:family 43 glycosylhydrolase [Natronohydrobacter thiooxidans]|uniref:family 43 glycosylhydrolase n=1 Tax=Natronohydrobacter thiooxidans TaxID=87172 RepID=UPI000A4C8978|nr:family 43 glycosylhydrolase [Natronohydrobacter thiooxidans]